MQTAKLLDGKHISKSIQTQLKTTLENRIQAGYQQPGLSVILVGEDPASHIYVQKKQQACDNVGIHSEILTLPANTSETDIHSLIHHLNENQRVHGILVQLPLPHPLRSETIIDSITPSKDVDGFHPYNIGRLALRQPTLRSCTPKGIMRLLEHTGENLKGLHAVMIGSSNIVGRPMALELLLAGCTVTVCHKFTQNIQYHVENADILVVAVGKPKFIPGEWIKPKAIVIDVGINRTETGELLGDIDFDAACKRAEWITPVPGGVGPMTVAMLLENTLAAAEQLQSKT